MSKSEQTQSDNDSRLLNELGYAQELKRSMAAFSNFAVSFSIISILSGCMTLYGYGMETGGPIEMSIGWPVVGVFVLLVGLAMAEVCSAYPTSGGLYFWSAKLASPRTAPIWSWFTGWFNLLGEFAITAGIDFGLAQFVGAFANLHFGLVVTPPHIIEIYAVILVLHALLNVFGVRLVAILNDVSAWWHVLGVAIIVCFLVFIPAHHQSASWVFTEYRNQTGWGSIVYVLLIGLLLAQYTFTGYDASAHMSEETSNAQISAPKGIVWSIGISLIAGWALLLAVTFAIQDYQGALNSPTGVPPFQIMIDAVGNKLAIILEVIIIIAQFFCGMASVTANSRMIYAFSRDGAVPGHQWWSRINKKTRTPTNSVLLGVGVAFMLGVPYLWSPTAYGAITSIAVIGLYIAYVMPVFLRVKQGNAFQKGPWNLGRFGVPVGIIAILWVAIITVLFILPQSAPITAHSFNYSIVAVGFVLLFSGGYWVISARKWFEGPVPQGSLEELRAKERELEQI